MLSLERGNELVEKLLFVLSAALLAVLLSGSLAFAQENDKDKNKKTSETDPENVEIATSEDGVHYVPGELVIATKGTPKENTTEVMPVAEQTLKGLKEKAKEIRAKRADAEIVEPNYVGKLDATPNDPRFDDQYWLKQVGAPGAWNDTKGTGTRVCVIDSGWDRDNPEFTGKVIAERDQVSDDGIAQDGLGHGTAVAGVVGAETDNGLRTAALGWDTRLAIARAADNNGNVTSANASQALNWCQNVGGVSVVNMSFGWTIAPDVVQTQIAESDLMGQTLVASVGNQPAGTGCNARQVMYPAGFNAVIGVGASTPTGSLACFSYTGPTVDLVAPGVDIMTAATPDGITTPDGTSFSAPQVAATASLLYAKGLTQDQVRSRLYNQAEDRGSAGRDDYWGNGFLNARCATQPNAVDCPPG